MPDATKFSFSAALKRLLRGALAGFVAGVAVPLSTGQPVRLDKSLLYAGIVGLILGAGKAARDATGNELTP